MPRLQYIPTKFLADFEKTIAVNKAQKCFQKISHSDISKEQFQHMITASSVASSQIEGNSLDLDSYFKSKQFQPKNKEVIEIEDLISAYQYARRFNISENTLLTSHKMLAAHFKNITARQKGKYRTTQVGIRSFWGLVYLAVEPQFVSAEMNKLLDDVKILLSRKLTFTEAIYYAAFIHFLFAKIHPFADGNGRSARLLEKWFLSRHLGANAWALPTEVFYWQNRSEYYDKLNVGVNYYETLEKLEKVKFHHLLPQAICFKP